MATNGFTVWASNDSAQLMDEDAYKRKAELGLTPGIADLEQANMSWRQASMGSAIIGELVATDSDGYEGQDFGWKEKVADLRLKFFKALHAFSWQTIKEYLTQFRFVSFTEDQETTDEERERARKNMDAVCASKVKALCDEIVTAKGA